MQCIFMNFCQKTLLSSSVDVRYGVYVVGYKFGLRSTLANVIL